MKINSAYKSFSSAFSSRRDARGFALISSILIMALLVMVAMGMLSLSTIEVRSSQNSKAMAEAQANARMALMIAIGELQRATGSDTRVTAPADIVESGAPPLTGVWRSWEGSNHDSTGRPIKPDYTVKTKSESSSGRFLTWLVSGAESGQQPMSPAPSALVYKDDSTAGTIPLLSKGTLGEGNPGQVHVTPQLLKNENDLTTGSFAWWVSPENQKARLIQPHQPRTDDVAGWVEMGQSHTVANAEVFGLDSLVDEPFDPSTGAEGLANKALSLRSTELIVADNPAKPQQNFHNLSTSSVGLLTNTATGGWRKDLSILTEKWDAIYSSYPGGNLPLFRYSPDVGDTSLVAMPTRTSSNHTPDRSTLYPWSEYSQFSPKKWPNTWHAASSSWQSLVNFSTLYKSFTYSNGAAESPFKWAPVMKWRWQGSSRDATPDEFYEYNHTSRVHPVIARFQFIVYLRAFPDPNPNRPDRYGIQMIYSPVVTLWNPYNVRVSIDNPGPAGGFGVVIGGKRSFPGAFAAEPLQWYPGGPDTIPLNRYRMLNNGNMQYADTNGNFGEERDSYLKENIDIYKPGAGRVDWWKDLRTWGINFPTGELAFEPGEVRMFSPNANSSGAFAGSAMFATNNGYQPGTPSGIPITIRSENVAPDAFYWYVLKSEVYTQPFKYRSPGRGFHVGFGTSDGATYAGAALYTGVEQEMMSMTALTNGDRAKVYWPDEDFEPHGYSVAEIASVPAMPLYSITLGPRLTIGTGVGTPQSRPTKGFLQNDPLAGMSLVDPGIDNQNSHPANGNFEISYNTLSFGSSLTPNLSDREGFMVTGFQSGDGLSRLISHELPLRPMASLVELQAWNPRGKNPMPPYQSHLIGNSDASPMILKDNIVPSTMTPSNVANNLQHDDAYCANHLLFDDFFLSSIAPRPVDFGNNIAKDIETVYSEFLKGDTALTNRAYRPISDDTGLSDSEVTQLVSEIVNSPEGDGWLKIASRLEVDGMFNVNSTSVDAWKALLGHAQGMSELGIYGANGLDTVKLSTGNPVTRGAAATDVEAGNDPAIGGGLANAAELTGFRSLTDEQIEDLAEKIVEQVRLRGPFLSLSEFVNRQLSNDNDLAIAGAVQSAINNMEDDPMSVLRDSNNFLSDETMASKAKNGVKVNGDRLDGVDYEFGEAAEGSSVYGMPGWIRQADVLRPIAPILSARDDTFTIRAYGDSLDKNGDVVARAWCEATVRRQRDYVDSDDAADAIDGPTTEQNQKFGRKYGIVLFRWLNPSEI